MTAVTLILYVFAFVFFAIAATNWNPEPNRTRLIAVGLACVALAEIIGRGGPLFGQR